MTVNLVGPSTGEGKKGLQRFNPATGGQRTLMPMFEMSAGIGRPADYTLQGPFSLANTIAPGQFTPRQIENVVANLPTIHDQPYVDYTLVLNMKTAALRWMKKANIGDKVIGELDLGNEKKDGGRIADLCRRALVNAAKAQP